jgi:hypothetical protein
MSLSIRPHAVKSGGTYHRGHPVLIVVVGLVVAPLLILGGLWVTSLPILTSQNGDCTFGEVSSDEYRRLVAQAKSQQWTVWPSLSNGIFWPSDRGLYPASRSFEKTIDDRLQQAIERLSFDHSSANAQLAAAHAVLRSIGADYVSVFEIPDFRQGGKLVSTQVEFLYFLPQRRFAPLCLVCFLWRYSTVGVFFHHDLLTNTYRLRLVNVLHGELKYSPDPNKARNVDTPCPAFPKRNEK